jgi:hypothetical protein
MGHSIFNDVCLRFQEKCICRVEMLLCIYFSVYVIQSQKYCRNIHSQVIVNLYGMRREAAKMILTKVSY